MVDHGLGVVDADDALGGSLHGVRGVPGVVDVLRRETSQNGQVTSASRGRLNRRVSHTWQIVLTSTQRTSALGAGGGPGLIQREPVWVFVLAQQVLIDDL